MTTGKSEITEEDLKLKIDGQSTIDKAIRLNRDHPLSSEEMSGFVKAKLKPPTKYPFIKVSMPDKEDGPKGMSVLVGVKGKF